MGSLVGNSTPDLINTYALMQGVGKSTYAQYLPDKGCVMDPNENTMQIPHIMKKGNHMNNLQKFCIYKGNNRNNQINDGRTTENKIFDTIIRYGTPYTVSESPYST